MWTLNRTIDLTRPDRAPRRAEPIPLMYPGDNQAHTLTVTVLNDGAAATLTGTPYGCFTRDDGQTVVVEGTLTGNVIAVTLTRDCYAIRGALRAVIRLGDGIASEAEPCASLLELNFHIRDGFGETYVGPDVFPTLETLAERVDTLEDMGLTSDGTTLTSAQELKASIGLVVTGGRPAIVDENGDAVVGGDYGTTPVYTGMKWTDGKKVYMKALSKNISADGTFQTIGTLDSFKALVSVYGCVQDMRSGTGGFYSIPFAPAISTSGGIGVYVDSAGVVKATLSSSGTFSNCIVNLICYYTRTTD